MRPQLIKKTRHAWIGAAEKMKNSDEEFDQMVGRYDGMVERSKRSSEEEVAKAQEILSFNIRSLGV